MKHTPGPWETSSNASGELDICCPDAGDMIADLSGCDNADANARLIAAAPELLEALRIIKSRTTACGNNRRLQRIQAIALAAIAKAEGRK